MMFLYRPSKKTANPTIDPTTEPNENKELFSVPCFNAEYTIPQPMLLEFRNWCRVMKIAIKGWIGDILGATNTGMTIARLT